MNRPSSQELLWDPDATSWWQAIEIRVGVLDEEVLKGDVSSTFESLCDSTVGFERCDEEVYRERRVARKTQGCAFVVQLDLEVMR